MAQPPISLMTITSAGSAGATVVGVVVVVVAEVTSGTVVTDSPDGDPQAAKTSSRGRIAFTDVRRTMARDRFPAALIRFGIEYLGQFAFQEFDFET